MYNFFNPEGSLGQSITLIGITWQYWLGVLISLFSIGALFVFKKTYAKLFVHRWLMTSLGIFQILLYFVYYLLHFIYLYGFGLSGSNLRGWTWILPLHLSSITQILSGIMLIKPNSKIFSVTAPWAVIMVFASILIPADKAYGPQHFSYWSYYVLHIIIIFTYWYLYMYGFVKYERNYLGWSFIGLILFSLTALSWNALSISIARISQEVTNLLFIGRDGYPLSSTLTTGNIWDRSNRLWPLGYIPIAGFGLIFVSLGHLLISKIQPYYEQKNGQIALLKRHKQSWDFKAFKDMWKHLGNLWR